MKTKANVTALTREEQLTDLVIDILSYLDPDRRTAFHFRLHDILKQPARARKKATKPARRPSRSPK